MSLVLAGLPRILNSGYYLAISAFFVYITFNQTSFDYFLYYSALPLFVVEFVSLHSSIFLTSELSRPTGASKKELLLLVFFYSIFVAAMSYAAKNFLLLGHFWVSSYAKYSSLKAAPEEEKDFALKKSGFTILLLAAGVGLAQFTVLPFSPPALSWDELARAAGESKSSVSGSPPNFLSAGLAMYFLLLALAEYYRERVDNLLHSALLAGAKTN